MNPFKHLRWPCYSLTPLGEEPLSLSGECWLQGPLQSLSAAVWLSLEKREKSKAEDSRKRGEREAGRNSSCGSLILRRGIWKDKFWKRCVLCNRIPPWLLPFKESTERLVIRLMWWSACLIGIKLLVLALGLHKPVMPLPACNPSILESGGRGYRSSRPPSLATKRSEEQR